MRTDYQPCDFTIFGVLGDLSRRKLIPSLYQLDKAGMLHEDTRIIGVARHDLEQDGFVDEVRESLSTFVEDPLESEVVGIEGRWHRLLFWPRMVGSGRSDSCELRIINYEL